MLHTKRNRNLYLFVTVMITVVLSIVIYREFIFGDAYYISATDTAYQFLPYLSYLSRCIYGGTLPTWSFLVGVGDVYQQRYIGDICSMIPCLFGETIMPYTFVYLQILKMIISAVFIFLFLNKIKISNTGSMIGAIAYSFSSIMMIRGIWLHFSTEMMLFAIILWSLEEFFQNNRIVPLTLGLTFMFLHSGMYYIVLYAVVCFGYALVRYYLVEGSIKKKVLIRYFGKGFGIILLAGFLSCGINLPLLIQTTNTGRMDGVLSEKSIPVLAEGNRILSSFINFFSGTLTNGYGGDLYNNGLDGPKFFVGVLFICILPLFIYIENKKVKKLVSLFLGFLVLYIMIPMITYVCNMGISYSYFKLSTLWMCVVIILVGVCILDQVVIQGKFKNKTMLIWNGILIGVFAWVCFFQEGYSQIVNQKYALGVMLLLVVYNVVLLAAKKIKSAKLVYVLFVLLCAELTYSGCVTSEVAAASAIAMSMEKGVDIKSNKALVAIKESDENLFYRVAWEESYLSTALLYDLNGIGYFDDIGSGYVEYIANTVETGQNIVHGFYGYHDYWLQDILLGVKYRVFNENDVVLTDYYEKMDSYGEYGTIYENKNAFSIGVMYDEYLSYEQMDALEEEEKQFNLLNAIVSDAHDSGKVIEYPGTEIEHIQLNCDIEDVVEILSDTEDGIKLMIPNDITNIIIPIENGESGTYKIEFKVRSKNYDFNICSIQWYDGTEWHYVTSIDDIKWCKAYYVEDNSASVVIKDVQPKAICVQFANGEDEVIIQDFNITVYDEEKLNDAIDTLVEERQQQGMLELDEFSDTKIVGHIDCAESGTMLLSIPYHKGWSAYVDGQKVEIQQVNYGFSGIDLQEGEHEIVLQFTLPGQKLGIGLTIAAFLTMVTISIVSGLKKQKEKAGSENE